MKRKGENVILNIHGFASHGENSKSKALRENGYKVISPTLAIDPKEAIKQLEDSLDGVSTLMGTSLGGFYALYLSTKYKIPALLINPSTEPNLTMSAKVGRSHTNYKTGLEFEWTLDHMKSINKLYSQVDLTKEDLLILLGSNDTVVDPEVTKRNLINAEFLEYNTDHRFSMFEQVLKENQKVKEFLT
jgi:predicted esterase YcpF (UPF0227 family)